MGHGHGLAIGAKMIHENVELHNVAEVQPANGGVRLQRVPEVVRGQLNDTAQMRVRQPDNCEIRFVSPGPVEVTLSSEAETYAVIFQGVHDGRRRCRIGSQPVTVSVPLCESILGLDRSCIRPRHFAPQVRRIIFGSNQRSPVILHAVSGQGIRPPRADELPPLRYLAYGTSIAQGFDCEAPYLSYVAQAAWRLGADLINLGVGGSCHCERAMADYIAGRDDWDVASLELSVNMRGFPLAEFRQRVGYMVETVAAANPRRTVACLTLFPFAYDLGVVDVNLKPQGTAEEYRQALRDVVRACPHPNVYLIEGPDLLTELGGLTVDLVHPSDNGMIEIGANLARRLGAILKRG